MFFHSGLQSHKWKIAGMYITGISIVLLVLNQLIGLNFVNGFSTIQHTHMFWLTSLWGLYFMMFSKEKNDDERVKAIRAKAMRFGYTLAMASLLSLSLFGVMFKGSATFSASALLILPTFCLIVTNIMFYIGYYFDSTWNYTDNNPKRKGWMYIVYISITAITLGIIAFKAFVN